MQVKRFLNYPKYFRPKVLSTIYVNQTNLNGKLRKKLEGPNRSQENIWGGMAHPAPHPRSATQGTVW